MRKNQRAVNNKKSYIIYFIIIIYLKSLGDRNGRKLPLLLKYSQIHFYKSISRF